MTTALTRFTPFSDAFLLPRAFDWLKESWIAPSSFFGVWDGTRAMPLDLYETDDAFVVTALMPGVPTEKLDVKVQQDTLTIRGEISSEQQQGVRYLIKERGHGVYERSIQLPVPVDAHNVTATLQDGVLTVTLSKAEGFKARRIKVKAA